jgi:formylglycine-generating enzyme required for sulfatase activity
MTKKQILIIVALALILLLSVICLAGIILRDFLDLGVSQPMPDYSPLLTYSPYPTQISPAETEVPNTDIGSTSVRSADGMVMVYVPAGEFSMGSTSGYADEQPVHSVTLDTYWIDKTEVTNAMYALCVQARACQPPGNYESSSRTPYYGNSQYGDFPVIYVTWNQADTYCNWAGSRLPTEAEWEKAARGTDERTYPWGNNNPSDRLLNFNWNVMDTTVVGNYPSGASPYGAQDMAGNVCEWVNDWYSDTYYSQSPAINPTGPSSGQYRVLRGGAWDNIVDYFRSTYRLWVETDGGSNDVGFRCVLSP